MNHFDNVLGGCSFSNFNPDGSLNGREVWTGGALVSKSHTKLEVSTIGGPVSGTSSGSYPGNASGSLNLMAASSEEYNSVCNGNGNGSISALRFDPSTSRLTIGEA
jgi:hypothetical protein